MIAVNTSIILKCIIVNEFFCISSDILNKFVYDGQDVINRQIEDKYDLFIGIMYTKFGSPTNRAESGTVEEFEIAYKKAQELINNNLSYNMNKYI